MSISKKRSIIALLLMLLLTNYVISMSFSPFSKNLLLNLLSNRQLLSSLDIENYGGFENYVNEGQSHLETTSYALEVLSNLGNIQNIEKDAAIEYVVGHQLTDGGYEPEMGMNISYIKSTYESINIFVLLNASDWIAQDALNWIKNRQLLNPLDTANYGGFEKKEGDGLATLENTYYGVGAIDHLNKTSEINVTATAVWISNSQSADGSFKNFVGSLATIEYTSLAIHILKLLNATSFINQSKTASYLFSKQNTNRTDEQNFGGFSNSPSIIASTLKESYYAIRALHDLNQLNNINETACINFLLQFQNSDGGFFMPPTNVSTVTTTFFAVSTLSLLGYEWNNGQEGNSPHGSDLLFIGIILLILSPLIVTAFYLERKRIYNFVSKNKTKLKLSKRKNR